MTIPNYHQDDEALARTLQEEYEAEYRRSQRSERGNSGPHSAHQQQNWPSNASRNFNSFGQSARHSSSQYNNRNNNVGLSDEQLARRLAAEDERIYRATFGSSSPVVTNQHTSNNRTSNSQQRNGGSRHTSSHSAHNSSRPTVVAGFPVPASSYDNPDEAYARRVEQELRDEEVARRFEQQEGQRLSRIQAQSMARHRAGCIQRTCSYLIPLAILGGAAVGLIWYFGIDKDDVNGFVPDLEDFRNEDPFNSKSPSEVSSWETSGGNGLSLEILNALDEDWHPFFYQAISDWENGDPDVLTLSTEVVTPESQCVAVQGKMKVCNGNYGETNWRGINEVLIQNNYIIASSAKMNEFYFQQSSDDQRQYTQCHEIGHGFGLPHSDENFYNKDLGDCMDYTNNPSANKQPGQSNFIFLSKLYGNVTGTASSTEVVPDDGNRRQLLRSPFRRSSANKPLPAWLQSEWDMHVPLLEQNRLDDRTAYPDGEHGWRMLHRSRFGEAHERDLGRGYTIRVSKLFAVDESL